MPEIQDDGPAPVEVKNTEPMPVTIEAGSAQNDAEKVRASAGVDAAILRTADQRKISHIWERTQQIIALSVVEVALLVAAAKSIEAMLGGIASDEAGVAFVFLASVANLVIGFYFGRTNHQKVPGGADPGAVTGR